MDGEPRGHVLLVGEGTGRGLAGFAHLAEQATSYTLEVVVDPATRDGHDATRARLLDAARAVVAEAGGGRIDYWVHHVDEAAHHEALHAGFVFARDLLQLRRSLPVEADLRRGLAPLEVRAFRPGEDEEAWLEVNNRAFVTHGEQGRWELADLLAREREPWFDPEGFLVHFDGEVLAGSCWTKVHRELTPPLGEIYVISVNPDVKGTKLGTRLVLSGLDWLGEKGLNGALLYVDATNAPARHLYDRLGFALHHTDRAYRAEVHGAGA